MQSKSIAFLAKSLLLLVSSISIASALKVNITESIPYVDVDVDGKNIRIQRIQDTNHKLKNSYTKTSRPTPPFEIQPFQPIKGIKTVTELDVIDFIQHKVSENEGLLLDARMPKWYNKGTIPGALNVPFSLFATKKENPFIPQVFALFGVEKDTGNWDFTQAQTLLIFDNGPWCQQGVHAMRHLVDLGYPKNKILYYRGGLQFWQIVGLTIMHPKD